MAALFFGYANALHCDYAYAFKQPIGTASTPSLRL